VEEEGVAHSRITINILVILSGLYFMVHPMVKCWVEVEGRVNPGKANASLRAQRAVKAPKARMMFLDSIVVLCH
jgi:hypothetical protein